MTYNHKTYIKEYYKKNRDKIRSRAKIYYSENKEKVKERTKKYYSDNPKVYLASRKRIRRRIMEKIFNYLGNECVICGEKNKIVLQIDHIKGKGRKHFLSTGNSFRIYYGSIIKSIEEGKKEFQLLCANCNISECVRKEFRGSTWIN